MSRKVALAFESLLKVPPGEESLRLTNKVYPQENFGLMTVIPKLKINDLALQTTRVIAAWVVGLDLIKRGR